MSSDTLGMWVNVCLAVLLTAHSPQKLRLALIDPKGVEFTAWRGIEHLALEVATDVAEACAVTGWLVGEMDSEGLKAETIVAIQTLRSKSTVEARR